MSKEPGAGELNMLPVADGATVLDPEVAAAISTIKEAIRRDEEEGEPGLRRINLLMGELDDAVFGAASTSRPARPTPGDEIPQALTLFGSRNLEVLARALTEPETFASALRFLLGEAPEELVVAHAQAAHALTQQGANEGLSRTGAAALRVCREVAEGRGFAGRLKSL